MHFTVNFRSSDVYGQDYSYGLVFIPCPVWVRGASEIVNLNPEKPAYRLGSVRELLKHEHLEDVLSDKKEAVIVVHSIGYGTVQDLQLLQNDLINEGFLVSICGQTWKLSNDCGR